MKRLALKLIVIATASSLAACSEEPTAKPEEPLTEQQALVQEGKRVARICTGCHGPAGISRTAAYPSLAGMPEQYLSDQLHAFRSGERQNSTMSSITINLTEKQIRAVSHYFAGLPAAKEQ